MADYKGMYLELLDKTSRAINLLQEGLLAAEDIYISKEEENAIKLVTKTEKSENEPPL